MNTRYTFLAAALCGYGLLLQITLKAEEGGSGHYLPGAMSSFVDVVPAKETFIARYNLLYCDGSVAVSQLLPIAAVQTFGADATISWHGLTLLWRPPIEIG